MVDGGGVLFRGICDEFVSLAATCRGAYDATSRIEFNDVVVPLQRLPFPIGPEDARSEVRPSQSAIAEIACRQPRVDVDDQRCSVRLFGQDQVETDIPTETGSGDRDTRHQIENPNSQI